MSQTIFYGISKNVEKPHIASEMPETSMEKHKWDKRDDLLRGTEICCNFMDWIAGRYKTIGIDKSVEIVAVWYFRYEKENVHDNKSRGDDRVISG